MPRNLLTLHSRHFYSHEIGMGKLYSQEKSATFLIFLFIFSSKAKQIISQPTTFLIFFLKKPTTFLIKTHKMPILLLCSQVVKINITVFIFLVISHKVYQCNHPLL